jgi:hypothetical protein
MDVEPTSTKLCIWQQNLNKSHTTQHSLLHNQSASSWDIYVLQEPCITNTYSTISSPKFYTIYPSTHLLTPRSPSHAVTLISTNINSNSWQQLPFLSSDVVVVQFHSSWGCCTIINIYNDCISHETEKQLDEFLSMYSQVTHPNPNDHIIWLGDFNRRHPLWDDDNDTQLFTTRYLNKAQPLSDLIDKHEMTMILPKGIPTLQLSNSKNWTCPDNVFCTDHSSDIFTSCNTNPASRGPKTDHVPITSILELEIPLANTEPAHNFHNTNWDKFKENLQTNLNTLNPLSPILTEGVFHNTARKLTEVIQETIKQNIPMSKPSPYSKHWWTHNLTVKRQELAMLQQIAYNLRALSNHPTHETL